MARGPRTKAKEAKAEAAAAPPPEEAAPKVRKGKRAREEAEAEAAAPKAGKKGKKGAKPDLASGDEGPGDLAAAAKKLEKWTENGEKFERWLQSRGLENSGLETPLLEAKGGILRMRDFFPQDVANSVLTVLEGLPEEAWELSTAGGDYDAASHSFWSADVVDVPELAPLRGLFWSLLKKLKGEPTLPIFSCGRYAKSDHIGRHDDRAHVPFFGGSNMYSRTVGTIWYLTRDWTEEDGGCFVDLEAKKGEKAKFVPVFNTLAAFEVPHWHEVTAVSSDKYRYSIFGWWHQSGIRYPLNGEDDVEADEAGAGSGAGAGPGKKKLGKKKLKKKPA